MPDADVVVDVPLARSLLMEQHPDLADLPLSIAAEGWDNVVFRLSADLALRVPRRIEAAALVIEEQRFLPGIASRLPVPVPAPVRVGVPGPLHPYAWSVVPWFEGRTASVGDRGSERIAVDVATFLRALHQPDDAPPVNPFRGVPLAHRDDETLRARFASGSLERPDELRAAWADALSAPAHDGPPVRIHGDLHAANLIVRDGGLAAVIDFGDTTTGDPATNVAVAWLAFDAVGRRALLAAIGADPALVRRARGWALVIGSAMATISGSDAATAAIGRRAIAQVLTG